ncbi:MAG: hypothetical protein ACYDBV_00870 [Nitrospiria bacterium]
MENKNEYVVYGTLRFYRILPRWMTLGFVLSLALSVGYPVISMGGPELALREFASGQVKKGVRSIGMGGDGATWGNYSLIYKDADSALFDAGSLQFSDTGNRFSFTAVGATTPVFWDNAALYVIALSQHANDVTVWSKTPASSSRPPSFGNGSNQALFVKFAKPVTPTVSVGLMGAYELSDMTLFPVDGAPAIRFQTDWRPSGGAGITWTPDPSVMMGLRIILNNDAETRTSGMISVSGWVRSNEYRAGVSFLPWRGGILDAGIVGLEKSSPIDGVSSFRGQPTFGIEQEILPKRIWLRAGRDEATWTGGFSYWALPFKMDIAYLKNLAELRTGDLFGTESDSVFATFTLAFNQIKN